MTEHVLTAIEDGVLTVRMNRPDKKNAITRAMYLAMAEALQTSDPTVGAILLAGSPGAFTSGNDIADFIAFASGAPRMGEVAVFLEALATCSRPLVAAVDGLAIGVGTTMLMHCDLAFASDRSVFRTPFLDLGLVPEAGSSLIAPRIMGPQAAFALLALGETFDAAAAKDAHLVYAIEPADTVEEKARAAARRLAAKPPEALRIARELLRGNREDIIERIRVETGHFSERLSSVEAKAAFTAFMSRSKG